jgi:hypothetical protein
MAELVDVRDLKPNILKMKILLIFLGVILVIMVTLLGCFTHLPEIHLPEITVQPASRYQLSVNKEGLIVAIEPFWDKEKVKELFGIDLLSAGILPLLIVVENKCINSNFIFPSDEPQFASANPDIEEVAKEGGKTTGVIGGASAVTSLTAAAVSTVADLAFAASAVATYAGGVAVITAPIAAGAIDKSISNKEIIKQNLIKKELKQQTIPFGKSLHGFKYFRLPKNESEKLSLIVELKAMNVQSCDTVQFTFPIR